MKKNYTNTPDICVSYYMNDIEWLTPYFDRCIFFDKSWGGAPIDNNTLEYSVSSPLSERYPFLNVTRSSINGYNIYDYLQYIIDFYEELPEIIYFIKGNTYPRHCSLPKVHGGFDNLVLERFNDSHTKPNIINPIVAGNIFIEANTSWYTDQRVHSSRFFASYRDFFTFCFPKHVVPDFVKFTPGACFSIESSKVTKYPKCFYMNLKTFVSHSRLPCEALFIERTLESIFEFDYEINAALLHELTDEQLLQLTDRSRSKDKSRVRLVSRYFWKIVLKISGYLYFRSITNLKG